MKWMCFPVAALVLAVATLAVRAGDDPPPPRPPAAAARPPALPPPASRAAEAEALRLAMLRMQFEQRQRFLRDLSVVQAQHHETMMTIIRNIAPSGRYEYNPTTGRYDRYVPYR